MPVTTPAQRIRVYASAAVDPTQTTVLTPRSGALHSDSFALATVAGLTGYKPYLQQQTQGRRGRLDFKSKKVDVGAFTFTCHDPRIDEASGNDERWLSQFYGDETARSALARLRVEYEESLDFDPAAPNDSTWRRLATLRVADVRQVRRLQFTLSTTDLADDLGSDCWIGDPHTSVSYAARAPLLPAGLVQPWGDFPADLNYLGGIALVTTGRYPRRVRDVGAGDRPYCVLTERVRSLALNVFDDPPFDAILNFASAPGTSPRIRVALYAGGVFQGWFWLDAAQAHFDDEEHYRLDTFAVVPAPELGGGVFPPNDTDVSWAWYETGPASEDSPILVGYVPAATLAADIIDGLFGELAVDGSPLHAVPRDGPSFANLAADASIPLVWARITERAVRREWIAEHICKPLQLGLMVNESGQVTLLDLRRQQTVATDLPEITDADLFKDMAGESSAWVSGDAITQIAATTLRFSRHGTIVTSVVDSKDRWPTVPAVLVDVADTELLFALIGNEELRALDFASKPEPVDCSAFATGFSPQIATSAALTAKQASRQGAIGDMASDLFAMFGHGAHYITLPARRTGVAEDTRAGLRRLLTASSIVDPRTNLRGTSQIALCIERNEQGIGSTLVFVALGLNTAADPPSVGTPVLGTECETTIDWPITLNAAGDAVQIQVLQQPIGDPTPDAIDVRWTDAVMVLATGTVAVGPLLSGYDVYLRARSEPAGGGTLPSDWIYPTPAFLATCGPETIAGCILSNITANGATLSWDAGTAEGQIYILVDGVLVRTLVEGTTSVTLTGLVDGAVITASSSPTGSPGCAAVFASNPDIITDPPPDPDPDPGADPSCGGTTPPRVHVFYVGPSAIRVGLLTEDTSFNIEVRSADVVPGTGPPIIPPGNPGGGVRIGALWHTPLDLCAGMGQNGAVRVTSWRPSASNYIERILDDAAARGLSIVVIPGYKSEYTTNGSSSGPFSPSLFNAMIDRYATVFPRLAAHIASRVFRSVMPLDEPNVASAWGGTPIPLSQVAAAMAYTKAAFPGLLVGVRADPSRLQGISWAGKMDFCVGQKNTLNSTESCSTYVAKIKAGAAALGLFYYLGPNPINGGADSSYFPGTATGRYMITPAEWPQFNPLASDPDSLGLLSWQYDPARPYYFGNAAVRTAMRTYYALNAGVGA